MPKHGLPNAVIDNTLLSRLVQLDIAISLPLLFKTILIPPEVKREAYRAPGKTKRRLRKVFKEMEGFFVSCPEADELIKDFLMADLDEGESAAIAQADKTKSLLLIDERAGRERAITMQIEVLPTTKVLCMLKDVAAINAVAPYLDRLTKLGFHLSKPEKDKVLAEVDELDS
jgi:predicted nucleic acid-binding protein